MSVSHSHWRLKSGHDFAQAEAQGHVVGGRELSSTWAGGGGRWSPRGTSTPEKSGSPLGGRGSTVLSLGPLNSIQVGSPPPSPCVWQGIWNIPFPVSLQIYMLIVAFVPPASLMVTGAAFLMGPGNSGPPVLGLEGHAGSRVLVTRNECYRVSWWPASWVVMSFHHWEQKPTTTNPSKMGTLLEGHRIFIEFQDASSAGPHKGLEIKHWKAGHKDEHCSHNSVFSYPFSPLFPQVSPTFALPASTSCSHA